MSSFLLFALFVLDFNFRLVSNEAVVAPEERTSSERNLHDEVKKLLDIVEEQRNELQVVKTQVQSLYSTLRECGCPAAGHASVKGELPEHGMSTDSAQAQEEQSDVSSNLVQVDFHDEAWVKEVFFGGHPWVIHCLNSHASVQQEVPEILSESAHALRDFATFGTISCWERLPSSQKTLAQRFKLPKPPLTLAIANGDAPVALDLADVERPEQLKQKLSQHLAAKITHVDSLAAFKSLCTKRKACLVVGYRSASDLRAANNALASHLQMKRGIRAVAIDSSLWVLRLDERFSKKRPVVGSSRADLLCISRGQAPPVPNNKRLARSSKLATAAREGQRGGAWFRESDFGSDAVLDFLNNCEQGIDLTPLLDTPWISHRKKAHTSSVKPKPAMDSKRPRPTRGSSSRSSKTNSSGKANRSEKSLPSSVKDYADIEVVEL